MIGVAVIVYVDVYEYGDCPTSNDAIPSSELLLSLPVPKTLLILLTIFVPVSVQTVNSSTVTFVANVKSLAIR